MGLLLPKEMDLQDCVTTRSVQSRKDLWKLLAKEPLTRILQHKEAEGRCSSLVTQLTVFFGLQNPTPQLFEVGPWCFILRGPQKKHGCNATKISRGFNSWLLNSFLKAGTLLPIASRCQGRWVMYTNPVVYLNLVFNSLNSSMYGLFTYIYSINLGQMYR